MPAAGDQGVLVNAQAKHNLIAPIAFAPLAQDTVAIQVGWKFFLHSVFLNMGGTTLEGGVGSLA